MASSKTKVVGLRLKKEIAEYFEDKNLKEIVENLYENPMDDSGLQEICFLYDIDRENLIKNIRWLLDSGKLFVRDGKLRWNPMAMNPEYFSLDDRIDLMNLSSREKDRIKRTIAENLDKMAKQDDIGNGAGV